MRTFAKALIIVSGSAIVMVPSSASALSVPAWVSPVWTFLEIFLKPTPTGGCTEDGRRCADML